MSNIDEESKPDITFQAPKQTKSRDVSRTTPHIKARSERPAIYPERFTVPDAKTDWTTDYPEYRPKDFTAERVLEEAKKPNGWAESANIEKVKAQRELHSYEGEIHFNEKGRPLNPKGRTGIEGRGLLGKWGANFAADPIITRLNSQTGQLEMLAIQRRDNKQWAIPGGMVDEGEAVTQTLNREFREEAGVDLDMTDAKEVYKGYVDDPRNTDNAWMETTASHKHLSAEIGEKINPKAGDDAQAVRWLPLNQETLSSLYASHAELIKQAVTDFYDREKGHLPEQAKQQIQEILLPKNDRAELQKIREEQRAIREQNDQKEIEEIRINLRFKNFQAKLEQITTRGDGILEAGEAFRTEDIDFGAALDHVKIHQNGEVAGSQFNGNIIKGSADLKYLLKKVLPETLHYDQFGRAELTLDITNNPEEIGWSGVKSIQEIKTSFPDAQIEQRIRTPDGTEDIVNGVEGAWYPETGKTDKGWEILRTPEGQIKNPKAKFEPRANIARVPKELFQETSKTNKITLIIQKDRLSQRPTVLTMFPGKNAPAFPARIDTEDYKTDSLGDSKETKFWKEHAFIEAA